MHVTVQGIRLSDDLLLAVIRACSCMDSYQYQLTESLQMKIHEKKRHHRDRPAACWLGGCRSSACSFKSHHTFISADQMPSREARTSK